MNYTIKTRKFGALTFWCQDGGGYVYVDINGQHGCLGQQICEGGGFRGNTVYSKDLPTSAHRWWKQYSKMERKAHQFGWL
jgi:hypothetical protein